MSNLGKNKNHTWTVTAFEFDNYLHNRGFLISTLVSCLLILVLVMLPLLMDVFKKESGQAVADRRVIYLMDESASPNTDWSFLQAQIPDFQLKITKPISDEARLQMIREKDVYGVFRILSSSEYEWQTERLALDKNPHLTLKTAISLHYKENFLTQIGLAQSTVRAVIDQPTLKIQELAQFSGKSQSQTLPYTYALIMLLYMSIMTYGQLTATSVASEKSSRAMEILITSTKPRYLINGKVLGTGLAGVCQMLVIGLVYYLTSGLKQLPMRGTAMTGSNELFNLANAFDMPPMTFLMAVVVFICSYFAFAFIYSALGSLVSRSEDVSQVISPITMIYITIFIAALFSSFTPDKTWVAVLSYVPLAGPLVFFVRYSMLSLEWWQVGIPLFIHALTVVFCARLAVTLYRAGSLYYGKPPKIRELFKIFRSERSM